MFYVYHKVKGDRMSGPDYDLLETFEARADAETYADQYNEANGFKKGQGFHLAVVRTRKVKEPQYGPYLWSLFH